jgi:hypothetical protein
MLASRVSPGFNLLQIVAAETERLSVAYQIRLPFARPCHG